MCLLRYKPAASCSVEYSQHSGHRSSLPLLKLQDPAQHLGPGLRLDCDFHGSPHRQPGSSLTNHPSAWQGCSANFALTDVSEVHNVRRAPATYSEGKRRGIMRLRI